MVPRKLINFALPWEGDAEISCSPRIGQTDIYELDNTYSCRADGGGLHLLPGKDKIREGGELGWWWTGFLVALGLSMFLMAKAAERLPIGTVYPVWTGIGAVGAMLVGIFFFHEPATFWRIFFITTLILSIVGLKVVA